MAEAHTHVSESTRFCRLSKNHMNSLFSPFVRSTFTHVLNYIWRDARAAAAAVTVTSNKTVVFERYIIECVIEEEKKK